MLVCSLHVPNVKHTQIHKYKYKRSHTDMDPLHIYRYCAVCTRLTTNMKDGHKHKIQIQGQVPRTTPQQSNHIFKDHLLCFKNICD